MTPHPLGALLTGLALAAAAVAAPSTPPTTPAASPAASHPPVVPCPIAKVSRPRPAPVPTPDRSRPTIGGDALATTGLAIPPDSPPLPKNLSAQAWVVADLDTGQVLGACAPHEYFRPASVQKLLLAATLMPRLDPKQVVQVTADDLHYEPGSSAVGLVLNGKYTVRTLWLGLLLNSGNDAANTLARIGGGPIGPTSTIDAMNAEAHELGAYDTHAVTPSGLDGPGQVTSAYDLALIARACFARADFRHYVSAPVAQIPAQPPRYKGFQIQNDNPLLTNYRGAIGGKTGFTDLARHTFVGVAERDGRRLVVTILGAEAKPIRGWQQGAELLDWGFLTDPQADVGHLVAPGEADRSPTPTAAPTTQAAQASPAFRPPSLLWAFPGIGALTLLIMAIWGVARAVRRNRETQPD